MMPRAWPRARGKVGQVESPPELAGKWIWSLFIVIQSPGQADMPVREIHSHELKEERFFTTEREAKIDLEKEAVQVCKILNEALGGTGEEGFFDMMDDMKVKTKFEGGHYEGGKTT